MMLGNNCKKLNIRLECAFIVFTVAKVDGLYTAVKSKQKLWNHRFCADYLKTNV